jgi:Glycosyl transferase family 11
MGGLGNTLFQFFFGKVLKDSGIEVNFIDVLVKSNLITRAANWKIHTPIYKQLFDENLSDHNVLPAILASVLKKLDINSSRFLFYRGIQDINKIVNNGHVFGYFQDPDIFAKNLDSFYLFCDEIYEKLHVNQKIEQVVHLRFGDRLNDKRWLDNNMMYHEKIREIIKKSPKITTIVTDSISHCRAFIGEGDNIKFSDTGDSFDDFLTLCSAESLIISSSTFSWWAAHLNRQCKQVYMPNSLYDELGFYNKRALLRLL